MIVYQLFFDFSYAIWRDIPANFLACSCTSDISADNVEETNDGYAEAEIVESCTVQLSFTLLKITGSVKLKVSKVLILKPYYQTILSDQKTKE